MKEAFATIINEMGENLSRPGLEKTPERAAMAMQFFSQGYKQNVKDVINNALFPSTANEMIVVKEIEFYSLCEHHLLPFFGKCHVGYIPNGKVIGISKIPRIIEIFARRLQIQENLTIQIAEAIQESTDALGVGVILNAQHMCMMMRGIEKQNSQMTTSCMLGYMKSSSSTRNEFLHLVS